ncbi:hypothetical protein DTO027B9_6928 [Paecilomyces variotii]|nr:hypothetical protein DTO027B9_6928 [Paecilomyces variotii]
MVTDYLSKLRPSSEVPDRLKNGGLKLPDFCYIGLLRHLYPAILAYLTTFTLPYWLTSLPLPCHIGLLRYLYLFSAYNLCYFCYFYHLYQLYTRSAR